MRILPYMRGVSYKVFDFDSDMLIWGDEGAYYRME